MENVYENVRRKLSAENVKEALNVMLERLQLPENEASINTAKESGDDMVEVMKNVFPIVIDVQVQVVGKFGFTPNHEGLKDFLIRANGFTQDNPEILELLLKIRQVYLPGFDQKAAAGAPTTTGCETNGSRTSESSAAVGSTTVAN